MVKSKNTKRALLASVLSVALCCAMLVGSTFAWFTDSVTSAGNRIVAGNLKVDLIHVGGSDDGQDVSVKDTPDHKIFDCDKWEPGYTAVETLRVVNKGNLALKFRLDAVANGTAAGPNGGKLADVIDVYVYEGEGVPATKSFAEMTTENNWRKAGSLSALMADRDGMAHGVLLPAGETPENGEPVESVQMTVALHMQESAGNEYQGLSLGDLNFTLNAAQYTYERDSFDNQYDKDAKYAIVAAINNAINQGALTSNTAIEQKLGEKGLIYFDDALRDENDGAKAITLHFSDAAVNTEGAVEAAVYAVIELIETAVDKEAANIYSVEIGHGRFKDDSNVVTINGDSQNIEENWVATGLLAMVNTYDGGLNAAFAAATTEGLDVEIVDIKQNSQIYRMYFDIKL